MGKGVTQSIPLSQKQKCSNVLRDSAPKVRDWSLGHIGILCLAYTKISDSKKESPVFGINHIVCTTNNVGIVNHPYQLEKRENTFQILAKGQLCKQAVLKTAASGLLLAIFCTRVLSFSVFASHLMGNMTCRLKSQDSWL